MSWGRTSNNPCFQFSWRQIDLDITCQSKLVVCTGFSQILLKLNRKVEFFLLFVDVWHVWSFFLLVKEKLPWCFTEGFCFFGWYIMLFGVKPKFFLTSGQGYWAILESESFLFTIHWWYCFQMKVFCWHSFENICRCCLDT